MDDILKEIKEFLHNKPNLLAEKRLAICKGCEYYGSYGRCTKCGCILAIKARLPNMKCPVSKW